MRPPLEIAGRSSRRPFDFGRERSYLPDGCCTVGHLERQSAGDYRVGEDGALADAACQHRRTRVGDRSSNLTDIDRAHVAAVENDPNTELRPKGARLVDEPQ